MGDDLRKLGLFLFLLAVAIFATRFVMRISSETKAEKFEAIQRSFALAKAQYGRLENSFQNDLALVNEELDLPIRELMRFDLISIENRIQERPDFNYSDNGTTVLYTICNISNLLSMSGYAEIVAYTKKQTLSQGYYLPATKVLVKVPYYDIPQGAVSYTHLTLPTTPYV